MDTCFLPFTCPYSPVEPDQSLVVKELLLMNMATL